MPNKGNAAQLLDKYKGLARDAQMSGDRVQQEYYLQFADHYFRVLEEFNAKKEEQQQKQQRGGHKGQQQNDDGQQASNDQQQDEKPKRSRRKPDSDDTPKAEKPKRAPRKPKKEDAEGGDSIADALPPAIGGDEEAA